MTAMNNVRHNKKSNRIAQAMYAQNQFTAGITVIDPSEKAIMLVALVMVMLTPARSVANRARSSTVPPSGIVILASRNASSSTSTSSTPTPRRMNMPTRLSDVNGTPKKITMPYPAKTLRATHARPNDACVAAPISGRARCIWVPTAATSVNVNDAMTSGISPVTDRAISSSKASWYANSTSQPSAASRDCSRRISRSNALQCAPTALSRALATSSKYHDDA